MKRITVLLFVSLFTVLWAGSGLFAQEFQTDDILGTWLNEEGTAQVEIYKEEGKYFGKIVWLKDPLDSITGKPRTDIENPDPEKQKKPLLGMVNLKNFIFDDDDEWEDGTIYDPKNGKTYSCYMKFEDETKKKLKIRGYIGISLLGRTTWWTPVKK